MSDNTKIVSVLLEAELSRQSGIRFLTNTGYYEAADNQFIPKQGEPDGGDFRGYTDIFDHLIPVLNVSFLNFMRYD